MSSPRRRQWQREVMEAERQRKAAQFKQRIGPNTTPILGSGPSYKKIDTPIYRAPAPTPPPVFSECVVGYRVWYVDPFLRLRPANVDHGPWSPGVNTAECHGPDQGLAYIWTTPLTGGRPKSRASRHPAPEHDCACGLYAHDVAGLYTKLMPEMQEAYQVVAFPEVAKPVVIGSVAGWGTMEVHRDGWRAEKACVTSLATLPDMPPEVVDLVHAVADRYEVPVVSSDLLALEGEQYGTTLDKVAKPDPPPSSPFAAMTEHMTALQRQLYRGFLAHPSPDSCPPKS